MNNGIRELPIATKMVQRGAQSMLDDLYRDVEKKATVIVKIRPLTRKELKARIAAMPARVQCTIDARGVEPGALAVRVRQALRASQGEVAGKRVRTP